MNEVYILDELYPDCPIRNILNRIGDKWSLLTLCTLQQGQVMRFGELQRSIPDISQKMLTATLRILEEDGLVERTIYACVPPKVEYRLTERAHTLLPHVFSLIKWAKECMPQIIKDRYEKRAAL